jgi:hypothetical protein
MIHGTTPTCRDYAEMALYTHNRQAFQRITRKIGRGYPRDKYACNTFAIVSGRMLCIPQDDEGEGEDGEQDDPVSA